MTASDASLVALVRQGDAAAFEALVRRHFRAAYLVALARVGERADAEDVCQEAWLRAWEGILECRDPSRFVGWLLTIVRNSAHNRREYLTVRAAEPLDTPSLPASASRTDDITHQGELRATLTAALALLAPNQREVVLLHDLEGWSHAEIAGRLAMSEVMSRRHLSDARKRLRQELGDYHTLMPDHD
jgi:RNA polymerase sigma-70 factor (ECF subfamily)